MSVAFSTSVSSPVKWTQKHCLLLRPVDQVCLGFPGTGSASQPLLLSLLFCSLSLGKPVLLKPPAFSQQAVCFPPGLSWACCSRGARLMLWSIPLSTGVHPSILSFTCSQCSGQPAACAQGIGKQRESSHCVYLWPQAPPTACGLLPGWNFQKSLGLSGEGMCELRKYIFLTVSESHTGSQPPAP